MKTKFLNIFLLLILLTGVAVAQERPRAERLGHERLVQRFRETRDEGRGEFLNLTDDQKAATEKIRLQTAKELKPLKDQLCELEARHQTLTTAEKPDMGKIEESIEKIGAVKIQAAKVRAKRQQEFRALLNEEQLLKMGKAKERPFNKSRHLGRG